MGSFKKGNKAGVQFSSTYQPKKPGRKPALYKQLVSMIGYSFKCELSREDFLKIQAWMLERTLAELKAIGQDPQTPAWIVTMVSAMMNDVKEGKQDAIDKIYDRLWGKAVQPIAAEVEVQETINLESITDEQLELLGEIIHRSSAFNSEQDGRQTTEKNSSTDQ